MSIVLSGKMMGAIVVGWNAIIGTVVYLRIWKPEWFEYPTVAIYATTHEKPASNGDKNSKDIQSKTTKCKVENSQISKNGMLCEIYQNQPNVKKTQNYINTNSDFVSSTSNTTIEKDQYYKILVSQKLLLELKDAVSKKITVILDKADIPIKLTPLFALEKNDIHLFSKEKHKLWIGKFSGDKSVTEITPTNSKYSCKSHNIDNTNCEIYDIQNGKDTLDLDDDISYSHSTTQSNKIKNDKYYLIEGIQKNENSAINLVVTSGSKSLQISEIHEAVCVEVTGTKTLFKIS